ncbi:MAG: hypothetical protein RI911_348 [Candidatus Parcubacteria bacterium]|jgi:hypothetical protein
MKRTTALLSVTVLSLLLTSEAYAFTPRAQSQASSDCGVHDTRWRSDEITQDQWGSYTDPYAYNDVIQNDDMYSQSARYLDDFAELQAYQQKPIARISLQQATGSSRGSAQGGGNGSSNGTSNIVALSSLPHTGGTEYISTVLLLAVVLTCAYFGSTMRSHLVKA